VLGGLAGGLYALKAQLGLSPLWAAILGAASVVFFFLVGFLPIWRDERKLEKLRVAGIRGRLKDPSYFRLSPYETDEQQRFHRPDSAVEDVKKWIAVSTLPILYLSGQSGAGKSSLINAAIAPSFAKSRWVVVLLRPHDDPLAALSRALLRPNAIWQKPPAETADLRLLFERAAERVSSDRQRLLLIVDQFEEALILASEPTKARLTALLLDLIAKPIRGLLVVLALRADYLNDLTELGLPPPAFGPGQNAFEVRPFTRAAAQAFIEDSGLEIGEGLLDKVLREAAEIEDMPDRVRPIVLNIFGLVISSFKGALPKGVEAGRLLSGYVERSLKNAAGEGFAVRILRPLVSDVGTKRALTTDHIADAAKVESGAARGCLIPLANDGLVRRLEGVPERWEVSHDFVARLLQPLLRNWRESAWQAARPLLLPALLVIWLAAVGIVVAIYPSLHEEYILSQLRSVGLVPGAPDEDEGATFFQNGAHISDQDEFWRVISRLLELGYPVVGLKIRSPDLGSLEGMPTLPALKSLDLSPDRNLSLRRAPLRSLKGMPPMPALKSLDLSGNALESLQWMPSLPELTSLKLDGNYLGSLQGMPALPSLTSLELRNVNVTDLQGMPAMSALASLALDTNLPLTSLRGMPALPALKSLDLSYTSLTNLRDLPALPELTGLRLGNVHGFASLQGMPLLPSLTSLELTGAALANLKGMPELPALTTLNLIGNRLEDLRGMPSLPALTSLELSFNPKLPSLADLPI